MLKEFIKTETEDIKELQIYRRRAKGGPGTIRKEDFDADRRIKVMILIRNDKH
jgi:hypothetical protein